MRLYCELCIELIIIDRCEIISRSILLLKKVLEIAEESEQYEVRTR